MTAETPTAMMPIGFGEQRAHVVGLDHEQDDRERGREDAEHPGRQAAFGGERQDLAGAAARAASSCCATVSSSSARFPPTSRWMRIAMTAHSRSTLCMRFAESSSASSIGRPRRLSAKTRWSSRRDGSDASSATASRPCANENPARIEPASRFERVGQLGLELAQARLAAELEEQARARGRRSPCTMSAAADAEEQERRRRTR